jgi:hypothetical protein
VFQPQDMCIILIGDVVADSHPNDTNIFCAVKDLTDTTISGPTKPDDARETEVTMVYTDDWTITDTGPKVMIIVIRAKKVTHIGEVRRTVAVALAKSNFWACRVNCNLDCCHWTRTPKSCPDGGFPSGRRVVHLENYAVSICENAAQLKEACGEISLSYDAKMAHAFEPSCYPAQADGDQHFTSYLVCNPSTIKGNIVGGLAVKFLSDRNTPLFFPTMHEARSPEQDTTNSSSGGGYDYRVSLYLPAGYMPQNARALPSGGGGSAMRDKLHMMLAAKETPGLGEVGSVFHQNKRTGHMTTLWVPFTKGKMGCLGEDRVVYEPVTQLFAPKGENKPATLMVDMAVVEDEAALSKVIEKVDIGDMLARTEGHKMYVKMDGCRENFNVCVPFSG